MQSIRLHLDGRGVLWLLAMCSRCKEVHKYLATAAAAGSVHCKSCRTKLVIEGVVLGRPSRDGDSAVS